MNKIVSVIAAIFIGWALSFSAALFADSEDGYTHSPAWSGAISQNDNKLYINKEDGSVHFSYDIGTLQAKGMSIPLALRYDSGTKVDLSGLGTNWSIHGLPTIVEYVPSSPTSSDPVTFTLYPGDGSSYSLLSSTNADGSLQYAAQPDKGAFEGIRV